MNAHDLLWGPLILPGDAPQWVLDAGKGGRAPVVVRRAPAPGGMVAVGVRGQAREQRYAAMMHTAGVQQRVTPEQLARCAAGDHWPALRALAWLQPRLQGWHWGVAGSAGFELASGLPALHQDSDLDLIVRVARPLGRDQARELLGLIDRCECRVDVQLQTPLGGVALSEWAGPARKVLLKTERTALLVEDPWVGVP